jgi:hypothetical protein
VLFCLRSFTLLVHRASFRVWFEQYLPELPRGPVGFASVHVAARRRGFVHYATSNARMVWHTLTWQVAGQRQDQRYDAQLHDVLHLDLHRAAHRKRNEPRQAVVDDLFKQVLQPTQFYGLRPSGVKSWR